MLNSFNTGCVILCFLAIAVTVIAWPQREKPWARYLKAYESDDAQLNVYKYIRAKLDESELEGAGDTHRFLQDISRSEAGPINVNQTTLRETVDELLHLADGRPDCSKSLVDTYIKLVEDTFNDFDVMKVKSRWDKQKPDHDVGLFNYLQQYGKAKFAACSTTLLQDYERALVEVANETERSLDELVACQVFNKKGELPSDKRLAEVASDMDLIRGGFKANNMMVVAMDHSPLGMSPTPNLLSSFITSNCMSLLETLGRVLDVYNLNRLLNPSSATSKRVLPQRFIKFNEYGAICVPFKRMDGQAEVEAAINHEL